MNQKSLILGGAFLLGAINVQSAAAENNSENQPNPNPYLAGATYGMTHFNPAQTDAFPYPAAQGTFNVDLRTSPRVPGGPAGIIQLVSTDPNYMWGLTTGNVSYVDVSDGGWKAIATLPLAGTKAIPQKKIDDALAQKITTVAQAEDIVKDWDVNSLRLINNTYSFVDNENVLYSITGPKINAYALKDANDPSQGIEIIRSFDFGEEMKRQAEASSSPTTKAYGMNIVGMGLTYDGYIVILTGASVSVIDRDFKNPIQTIMLGDNEYISNSQAVDEKGGIYVASDKIMRKLVWTGSKLSEDPADGAWASPYDFGDEPTSVKFGQGTGSTPTLMGFGDDEDKLVVITDGTNRMNIVAFWRDEIPVDAKQQPGTKSNRIAGQMGITCGLDPKTEFIQSEQSVVVNGYGAFVVNNIRKEGYPQNKITDVLLGGPVFAPPVGCERVEWNTKTNSWHSIWTRSDVVGTSMVPAMSSTSDIVFINGYTQKDGWEITGMDWNTGKTVTRILFGQDHLGNGAYATIQFLPDGDLLFNSIGGPIRVELKK